MLHVVRSAALAATVTALCLAQQAHAELPTSKLVKAPLIAPTVAWQYYNSIGMARTSTAAAFPNPPEIAALARSLGSERVTEGGQAKITQAAYAQNVYEYVRNNIATEFRFGLGKGARGALIDQSGTPFDQADLMAALLRLGGVTPTYKVGTVQLNAQQIGAWTGMARAFSTATTTNTATDGLQNVTVNAQALCQFLADGAIPATLSVGGGTVTSCASLSGDLSAGDSVTIGHIWIEAAGQVFDPSFKKLRFTQGLDLGAATGCGSNCGAAAIDAALRKPGAPAATGSLGGKPYFQNVSESGLNTQLTTTALNLETYVKTNAPNATIEQLIGGRKIDVTSTLAAPTGYLAYYNWSDPTASAIPDAFRSFITVPAKTTAAKFFGDELAGQRLMFNEGAIIADSGKLVPIVCGYTVCDVLIGVYHPYATNQGGYGDDATGVLFTTGSSKAWMGPGATPNSVSPPNFAIVIAWGDSTNSTESHYAALQRARGLGLFDTSTTSTDACSANCGNLLPTIGATVLKAQAMTTAFTDRITNAETTRHHTLGVVAEYWDGGAAFKTQSRMSMHSVVSVGSHSANAGERAASFEIGTQIASMLEGGSLQYANDSWEQGSAANLIVIANRNGQKLIDASVVDSTLLAALSGYTSDTKGRLQARVTEGYAFILPENDKAGSTSVTGGTVTANIAGSYAYRNANTTNNSGDDGAQAPLVAMDLKGGSPTAPSDPAQAVLRTVNDAPTNAKQKLAASADLATGAISLEAIDLVTGTGDFPNSLPFQRFYSSASGVYEMKADNWWTYEGPDDVSPLHLAGGWTHSYSYGARLGSNLEGALGEQGGLGASFLVSSVYTLFKMQDSNPFERRLTSLFAAKWISDQINGNAVIMSEPMTSTVFLRLPSGAYAAPLGSLSRVTVTGARTGPSMPDGKVLVYEYSAVRMTRTFADGSVMSFEPQETRKFGSTFLTPRVFRPIDWNFPSGMKVKFNYRNEVYDDNYKVSVLDSVSNSLGRTITILSGPVQVEDALVKTRMWRISGVKDETNRTVSYAATGCPELRAFICDTLSVTGTDTYITKYGYAPDTTSPNPTTPTRLPYRLRRIYPPSTPSSPIQTVVYDEVLRAKSMIDGLQRTTRYFPGSVVGTETWKRAEVITPRQDKLDASKVVFDYRNNPILTRNPLGYEVTSAYDAMGRLIRTELPDHNAQEFTYDARSNPLSTCDIPKTRAGQHCDTGQGDIIARKSYVEADTVWSCVNLASCNRTKTETDPRDAVTTYDWDSADLLNWVKGPVIDNQQSQVSLDYTTFTVGGSVIKFLLRKTQLVAAGKSIVTEYGYDAANKYVLRSAIVDPSNKAISTCFTYDDLGRLTSVTDPRAGACQ